MTLFCCPIPDFSLHFPYFWTLFFLYGQIPVGQPRVETRTSRQAGRKRDFFSRPPFEPIRKSRLFPPSTQKAKNFQTDALSSYFSTHVNKKFAKPEAIRKHSVEFTGLDHTMQLGRETSNIQPPRC